MGALALAMVALYELSMLVCRVMLSRRIKRQREAELAEAEA
jgi:Sec-independent protein secretion pathway component TatC